MKDLSIGSIYTVCSDARLFPEDVDSSDIPIAPGTLITVRIEGDWKHEHLRLTRLIESEFSELKAIGECPVGEWEGDYYCADHFFEVRPKEDRSKIVY